MSNTIDEALQQLRQATGKTFSPRQLLWHVLRLGLDMRTRDAVFGLPLMAVPPMDAKFGLYRCNAPNHPFFVRLCDSQWQTVTLWAPQIEQLFHLNEATISIVEQPEGGPQPGGHYVFIEPLDAPLRITLSMVRIPDDVLRLLAWETSSRTRTGEEPPPETEAQVSAPNPVLSNPPPGLDDIDSDTPSETLNERDRRIVARCDELKKAGVKDWQRQAAKQFGVHVSTIKKALRRRAEQNTGSAAGSRSVFGLSGRRHTTK